MRNVKKAVKQGDEIIKKRHNLDMTVSDLDFFYDGFQETARETGVYDALWNAIVGAYKMGLAVGMRNA